MRLLIRTMSSDKYTAKNAKVKFSNENTIETDELYLRTGELSSEEEKKIEEIREKLKNVMADEELDEVDELLDALEDSVGDDTPDLNIDTDWDGNIEEGPSTPPNGLWYTDSKDGGQINYRTDSGDTVMINSNGKLEKSDSDAE